MWCSRQHVYGWDWKGSKEKGLEKHACFSSPPEKNSLQHAVLQVALGLKITTRGLLGRGLFEGCLCSTSATMGDAGTDPLLGIFFSKALFFQTEIFLSFFYFSFFAPCCNLGWAIFLIELCL